MLDAYDPTELLSLIEGDLDARAAAALQSRLARDPQARGLVEAMVRDRALLRSIGEPLLPQDFLKEIEPTLSRPMLLDVPGEKRGAPMRPGEFRRRFRAEAVEQLQLRLAVAAVLTLAGLGAGWVVYSQWPFSASPSLSSDQLALNSDAGTGPLLAGPGTHRRTEASAQRHDIDELGPGVVHHARPSSLGDFKMATAPERAADTPRSPSLEPAMLAADFVIVLQAREPMQAEALVASALKTDDDRSALVRNFSFAEAQRLAEEYRLAHGGRQSREPDAPMIASATAPAGRGSRPGGSSALNGSSAQIYELAQRVREQWRLAGGGHAAGSGDAAVADLAGAAGMDQPSEAKPLAGSTSVAPTLEQQLDYSSRGATHTLSVPVSRLRTLIERLSLQNDARMILRALPARPDLSQPLERSGTTAPTEPPTLLWLNEAPAVRQGVARLARASDQSDAVVLVPIMIVAEPRK